MSATLLSYTTTINEQTIHAAMLAIVDDVAVTADPLEVVDRAAVARQPVSMAATLGDLCSMLGIRPPAFVRDALS